LQELATYNSTAFWEMVLGDIGSLVQNFESIASLADLVSSLGDIDIMKLGDDRELMATLRKALTDDSPQAILKK